MTAGAAASGGGTDTAQRTPSGPTASVFSPALGPVTMFADVYAGGAGMRNIGSGSITVAGLVGPATQAWLYWEIQEASPSTGSNVATVAGVPVTGTPLGSGPGLCWGASGTWAYRADITSLVSGPGPYSVKLNSGTTSGVTPSLSDPQPYSEGASIVALAPSSTQREIVIVDGYQTNSGSGTTSISIPRVVSGLGPSKLIAIGGGGQTDFSETSSWNSVLLASNSWQGSDPQIIPSYPMGNFWDTDIFSVSSVLGTNTFGIHSTGDCLGPEVFVLTTPVGESVPPPPCRMTGDAYMVNATIYPPPVGVTTIWSERTGPVSTTSTQQYGPTALATIAGPIVNGDVWGSQINTYAEPRCESYSRASVLHLDGGSNLPPALLPLEIRAVEVWSRSTCNMSEGATTIGYLKVGGNVLIDTTGTPAPNTVILSGPVTVILNEQTYTSFPGGSQFEVNAVRIIVAGVLDAKIVGAISDIHGCQGQQQPPPEPPRCPPGTIGTPPLCIGSPRCPPPTVGTFPFCQIIVTPCPPGTIGVPPLCVVPPEPLCPPPSTGTWPECRIIVEPCPPGSIGVQPFCVTVDPNCPKPTTGEFPRCRLEETDLCSVSPLLCIDTIHLCQPPEIGVEPVCFTPSGDEFCIEATDICIVLAGGMTWPVLPEGERAA